MKFKIHTVETAPEGAKESLEGAEKAFGFIPNLMGIMAEVPPLLKAYRALHQLFDETSFSATERQVVMITANYENNCTYCVAAHSVIAKMQDVPQDIVQALRNNTPIVDSKLEALRKFTRVMVDKRGWPSEQDVVSFESAGYTSANVLEVVLGIGFKTLSNYSNHLAKTPLDEAFSSEKWEKS